jgi:tRNA/tmRNA/rRNA uracil-C5-methylase (TrmA/RlmC/RlmD family)
MFTQQVYKSFQVLILMATPLCRYFSTCGGCSAQHIDYELQLENKRIVVARIAGKDKADIKVFHGDPYKYRNRMDLIFTPTGLGLREKGHWDKIVKIDACAISNDTLNLFLAEITSFFSDADAFDVRKHTGTYRYAVIRTPSSDSSISFVLNENSPKLGEAIEKIKEFAKRTTAKNILVTKIPANTDTSVSRDYAVIKGNDFLEEEFLGKKFNYSIQGFFQNNHFVAEKMLSYVREKLSCCIKQNLSGCLEANQEEEFRKIESSADEKSHRELPQPRKNPHLLDLYGGVGTFGIINADLFKHVKIIENDVTCIEAAKKNIEINNVINTEAIVLDAMQLRKIDFRKPLYVITDPPRSGMHQKTVLHLLELEPEMIIYISCNVQQFEKEFRQLSKKYSLKSAAMFDMFPQTPHIEAIFELEKK